MAFFSSVTTGRHTKLQDLLKNGTGATVLISQSVAVWSLLIVGHSKECVSPLSPYSNCHILSSIVCVNIIVRHIVVSVRSPLWYR